MSANPYATPSSDPTRLDSLEPPSATIRKTHLSHEASVKSIGILHTLVGIILVTSMIMAPLPYFPKEDSAFVIGYIACGLCIIAMQFWLGLGIRKLKKGARNPAIIIAIIGLFAFPIGTIISAYFLYLLCSEKGKIIFSPEYQQVIAETPNIKYRTTAFSWIILTFIVILMIGGIVFISKS